MSEPRRGLSWLTTLLRLVPLASGALLAVLGGRRLRAAESARRTSQVTLTEQQQAHDELRRSHGELELRVQERTAELTRANEALREAVQRYELAMRAANDGLWDWDLVRDELYCSPRWQAMLGFPEAEARGRPEHWFDLVHPQDQERLRAQIDLHLLGHTPHFEDKHRIQHQDGSYRWMLCRGLAERDAAGKRCRMAGSQTDITERIQAEEQLLHDAFEDHLTGLPNRAIFMDHLQLAWAFANRSTRYAFAVLFLDLDRFKVVNDSLGHTLGDQLLVAFARKLEACLRPGDTVARFGGDEFVILLDDIHDPGDALRLADQILMELRTPFRVGDHDVYTTVSIGIALSSTNYEHSEDLLRDANVAMYRAKAGGKSRHELADASMHSRAVARLQLETDLRRAVERESELVLYYQPIVALGHGRIVGFESLIRWRHPARGLVLPAEFIPLAEEMGLIVPIGRWALREACRQLCRWQQQGAQDPPLSVSVNLSGRQLAYAGLVDEIEALLQEFQPAPGTFRCEITESVIMDNPEQSIAVLGRLRELMIPLSVDDFGTGYSSLSYLQRFPVTTLKIDRSFVTGMGASQRDLEIVRAIAALAHTLSLDVIVEGIETREQLIQLRELRCEYGQGFLFSPPLDGEAVNALLAGQPQW